MYDYGILVIPFPIIPNWCIDYHHIKEEILPVYLLLDYFKYSYLSVCINNVKNI